MAKQKKSAKKNNGISEEKFAKARTEIKKILVEEEIGDETEQKKIIVEEESPEPNLPKKREGSSATTKDFARLYQSDKLGKVDMTKIDRKDPNRKKKIIGWTIFILLILLAVSLVGFYFFVNRQDKFSGENINIELETPTLVSSGEGFSFTILLQNNEEVGLQNAELTIQFPDDFRFTSSQPEAINEAHNAWNIGEIKSRASKKVKISGQIFGEIGSTKEFSAILTYVPANFNSEFQKNQSFRLTINDSVIDLDLEIPIKVISGYQADYKITYTNTSEESMENVKLTLTLPNDLEASNFEPEATEENNIWEVDELGSKESQQISFQGVLVASEGVMREIRAEVGYIDKNGEYHKQIEETSIIFVVNPQLILTLSINESTNNNVASFGETLNYVLKYQNESQSEIDNTSLEIELAGEVIDWDSLIDSNDGQVTGQAIHWDQNNIDDLKAIKPGDGGEIKFSINIKDNIVVQNESDINYSIISQAKAVSQEVVDLEGRFLEVESNSLITKINSRLDLRAEGRYYNDEYLPVGQGPIPPEVGQKTTYQIYWYLRNNTNEVREVTVMATLPADVVWGNDASISAGTFNYDPETRTVTWFINKIPPHVGQLIPELEARFAVEVTPELDDVSKLLILLEKSQVSADDSYTEEEIVKIQDLITSDLTTDPLASGKGEVIQGSSGTNSNTSSNTNSL